ncbi:MAG: OmpA family protein [Myxococcota bacterium]
MTSTILPRFAGRLIPTASLVLFFAAGCATPEPAQTGGVDLPPAGDDGVYQWTPPEGKEKYEPRKLAMVTSPYLRKNCPAPEPYFEFDESKLQADDRVAVAAIADCVRKGMLAGGKVVVTGRADERGSDQYNLKLALRRAKSVAKLLVDSGVDPQRVVIRSAGEEEALGAEGVAEHGYDRRVDVDVVPLARLPQLGALVPYQP